MPTFGHVMISMKCWTWILRGIWLWIIVEQYHMYQNSIC